MVSLKSLNLSLFKLLKKKFPVFEDDVVEARFKRFNGLDFLEAGRKTLIYIVDDMMEEVLSNIDEDERKLFEKSRNFAEFYATKYYKKEHQNRLYNLYERHYLRTYSLPLLFEDPTNEFKYIDQELEKNPSDPKYKIPISSNVDYLFRIDPRYMNLSDFTKLRLMEGYLKYRSIKHPAYKRDWMNSIASCSELEPVKQLGRGTFASAYLVKHKGEKYAMKIVESLSLNEVDITCRLRHPNLVECFGLYFRNEVCHIAEGNKKGILLEYCSNNLEDLFGSKFENLQNASFGLVSVVKYLHDNQYIHLDIKPQNIMLCGSVPKLIDFGSSIRTDYGIAETGSRTSIFYRPPEHFQTTSYFQSDKVDVWSLGLVLLELFSGGLVSDEFERSDEGGYYYKDQHFNSIEAAVDSFHSNFLIRSRREEYIYGLVGDSNLADLLSNMLNPEPRYRYTMKKVLDHYFFSEYSMDELGYQVNVLPSSTYPNNVPIYKAILFILKSMNATVESFFAACSLYNRISHNFVLKDGLERLKYMTAVIHVIQKLSEGTLPGDDYSVLVQSGKYRVIRSYEADPYMYTQPLFESSYIDNVIKLSQGVLFENKLYDSAQTLDQLRATYYKILLNPDINPLQLDMYEWYEELKNTLDDSDESKYTTLDNF